MADTTKKLTSFSDSAHQKNIKEHQKIKIKRTRPKICLIIVKNLFHYAA